MPAQAAPEGALLALRSCNLHSGADFALRLERAQLPRGVPSRAGAWRATRHTGCLPIPFMEAATSLVEEPRFITRLVAALDGCAARVRARVGVEPAARN